MTGKYKDFYKFVSCFNNDLCNIWEDFNKRPDPNSGDKFIIDWYGDSLLNKGEGIVVFDNVMFDPTFKNGVKFIYNFHDETTGQEYSCHSINDVEDPSKLTSDDLENLYGFWRYCQPINK